MEIVAGGDLREINQVPNRRETKQEHHIFTHISLHVKNKQIEDKETN